MADWPGRLGASTYLPTPSLMRPLAEPSLYETVCVCVSLMPTPADLTATVTSAAATTTADFLTLYECCINSSLQAHVRVKQSSWQQDIIIACGLPWSAIMAVAPGRHCHCRLKSAWLPRLQQVRSSRDRRLTCHRHHRPYHRSLQHHHQLSPHPL